MTSLLYCEDSSSKMWIENGFFFCEYKEGVIIDFEIGRKNVIDRLELCKGVSYPIFIDGTGVRYWTFESKKFNLSQEALSGVLAFAVLHKSYIQKILWNWGVRYFAVNVPSKVFTKKEKALAWLKKYKHIQDKISPVTTRL